MECRGHNQLVRARVRFPGVVFPLRWEWMGRVRHGMHRNGQQCKGEVWKSPDCKGHGELVRSEVRFLVTVSRFGGLGLDWRGTVGKGGHVEGKGIGLEGIGLDWKGNKPCTSVPGVRQTESLEVFGK